MSKRACQVCGAVIPSYIKVDGQIKVLSSRKRCLACSPFGFQGKKTGVPGDVSRSMKNYANWKPEWKSEHQKKVAAKGIARKQRLVELAGGKCQMCGYVGPARAMSFHHKDPKLKAFPMSANIIRGKTWQQVLDEFAKCELLCIRCHAEVEDELVLESIAPSF